MSLLVKSVNDEANVARKALLSIPLALFPGISLLMAIPLIAGLWPRVVEGETSLFEVHPMMLALSGVVAAAVLAVPGYFVVAFEEDRLVSMRGAGRWWIRASLAAAVLASIVAIPLTFFFGGWLWVFPAGSLAACLLLCSRSERLWRSAAREGGGQC